MLRELLEILVRSRNEAADDLLLEGLRVGSDEEKPPLLDAMIARGTLYGLQQVVRSYPHLPQGLQLHVLSEVRKFHAALREAGRSEDPELRIAAITIIAQGRQGMLAYVVAENLNQQDERVSRAAAEAMLALARWVRGTTCRLQKRASQGEQAEAVRIAEHAELMRQRPEIESALAKGIDIHRGRHGQELVQAALLLCDHVDSRTIPVLQKAKQSGTTTVLRRLQQAPEADQVPGFLLAASHAQLRAYFSVVFSRISQPEVLSELLRHTHWLKDQHLRLCLSNVLHGRWLDEVELEDELGRRRPEESGLVGEWIGASGLDMVLQDRRLERLRGHARLEVGSRLRLLRIALGRPKGGPVELIRSFLSDPDERLARLAARELARRRPVEYRNTLLGAMPSVGGSVRRVITRVVAHGSFEQYWQRFDRLDRGTRQQAGRTLLKVVPDVVQRLRRRLFGGSVEQRLKSMQMTCELDLIEPLRGTLEALCHYPNAKVRSRAVSTLGAAPANAENSLLKNMLNDPDARVRANAIELLEDQERPEFDDLLVERTRASNNRERGNAIVVLHRRDAAAAVAALGEMLRDGRAEHRISALWALRRVEAWHLIDQVAELARHDPELRVRRYAVAMVSKAAEQMQASGERRAG